MPDSVQWILGGRRQVVKMNVRELIEEINKYDEKMEVYIESKYGSYHFHVNRAAGELIDGKKFVFSWMENNYG